MVYTDKFIIRKKETGYSKKMKKKITEKEERSPMKIEKIEKAEAGGAGDKEKVARVLQLAPNSTIQGALNRDEASGVLETTTADI